MKITINDLEKIYRSEKCSIDTMTLKGYELVEELFVDNSGFGTEDELALTQKQFEKRVKELLEKYGVLYSTITAAGQFQIYIGLFIKKGKKLSKRIAKNVLRIDQKDGYIIRLYDTNILEYKNGVYTLNSGGFRTNTTKKWVNRFFDKGYVFQKDFEWFINVNDKIIPFKDGIKI